MTNVTTQLDEFKSTLIATIVDSADKYHLPSYTTLLENMAHLTTLRLMGEV